MSNIPESNGFVKRANRIIMEPVRCMLDDPGRSNKYWAFALLLAIYLKDHT
jgi:hypothetical protein